jgi:hypothetical protein
MVRTEKMWGVECLGHKMVKAAIQWYLAMLRQNHTPGSLPFHNSTANYLQIGWRYNRTGAPPPNRRRQPTLKPTLEPSPEPTPETAPALPGTLPAPTGNTAGAQHLKIMNLLSGDAYWDNSLACAKMFTLDTSAQDSEHDTNLDPVMLSEEGTSTG